MSQFLNCIHCHSHLLTRYLIYMDMCSIYDIHKLKLLKIRTPTLRFTNTFETEKVLKNISKLSLSTK